MARHRHFDPATPVLRYFNWAIAALVTLCAVYLHVLFLFNAGGLWRDEVELVHLSLLPSLSEVWQNQTTRSDSQAFKPGCLGPHTADKLSASQSAISVASVVLPVISVNSWSVLSETLFK